MSAFAVIIDNRAPVDKLIFDRMMERLSHRGPDGSDVLITPKMAIGHWHFWTTPEETGECQPLTLKGFPFIIVLDGRLDNRTDLFSKLGIDPVVGKNISDASLVLQSYTFWGENCVEHLIGDYAFVIFNELSNELFCVRDSVGERTLFYAWDGKRCVIASEPWAVAGAIWESKPELNEQAIAHYFAMHVPKDGQTLFEGINELLPAYAMLIDHSGPRNWCYWQPNPSRNTSSWSDADYAEEFRSILEESIRCRMRSSSPIGVMMSGGLDSTSIACLAARMLSPKHLSTISYVFNNLISCDERPFINEVKKQYPIHSIEIPCDDLWTFKDWQTWPRDLNFPGGNPFRMLYERLYPQAQEEGIHVLLTGAGGDQLFSPGVNWLAELLGEGRVFEAVRELMYFRTFGFRRFLNYGFVQSVLRRFLDHVPGGSRLHRRHKYPDWLSPLAIEYLCKAKNNAGSPNEKYSGVLGMGISREFSSDIFYPSRYKVELRHPFRDRRLIEFMLGLPARQLFAHSLNKHILRNSMKAILPESIRNRSDKTSFLELYLIGIESEKKMLLTEISAAELSWNKYINNRKHIFNGGNFKKRGSGHQQMIPWLILSINVWYNSIQSSIQTSKGE